jgi:rubrerythrin
MSYVDIKIRKEHATTLRELAARLGVKVADAVGLWPRCPKCMSPLVQWADGEAVCPSCRRKYAIVEP